VGNRIDPSVIFEGSAAIVGGYQLLFDLGRSVTVYQLVYLAVEILTKESVKIVYLAEDACGGIVVLHSSAVHGG
jgi:hypothetical protein